MEALKWLKQLMEQTTIKFPKIEHPQKIRKNDKWKNGETLKMRRIEAAQSKQLKDWKTVEIGKKGSKNWKWKKQQSEKSNNWTIENQSKQLKISTIGHLKQQLKKRNINIW